MDVEKRTGLSGSLFYGKYLEIYKEEQTKK